MFPISVQCTVSHVVDQGQACPWTHKSVPTGFRRVPSQRGSVPTGVCVSCVCVGEDSFGVTLTGKKSGDPESDSHQNNWNGGLSYMSVWEQLVFPRNTSTNTQSELVYENRISSKIPSIGWWDENSTWCPHEKIRETSLFPVSIYREGWCPSNSRRVVFNQSWTMKKQTIPVLKEQKVKNSKST